VHREVACAAIATFRSTRERFAEAWTPHASSCRRSGSDAHGGSGKSDALIIVDCSVNTIDSAGPVGRGAGAAANIANGQCFAGGVDQQFFSHFYREYRS
jgi:hypothetical protein